MRYFNDPISGTFFSFLDDAQTKFAPASTNEEALYRSTRYYLGLPEGATEFKTGDGLPLESNADLCNGVSFSKGCYVGQELTARSRFVGVVRKRLTPVIFTSSLHDLTT